MWQQNIMAKIKLQYMKFNIQSRVYISKNQVLSIFSQSLRGLTALLVLTIIARKSSPQDFAFIGISITLIPVIYDIFDFGGCAHATREIAIQKIDKNQFFSQLIFRNNSVIAISVLILFSIHWVAESTFQIFLLLIFLYLNGISSYVQGYLVGVQKLQSLSWIQLIERIIWLFSLPLIYRDFSPFLSFYFFAILGQCAYLLYFFVFIKAPCRFLLMGSTKNIVRLRNKHFGIQSLVSDLTLFDSLIVAISISGSGAGVYSYSQKFRAPMALGFNAFSQEIRAISSFDMTSEIQKMKKISQKFLISNVTIILFVSCLGFFFGQKFVGENYENLNLTLFLSILTSIFAGYTSIQMTVLTKLGNEKLVSRLTVFFTLFLFLGIILSSVFYGVVGAAACCLITNLIWSIVGHKYESKSLSLGLKEKSKFTLFKGL